MKIFYTTFICIFFNVYITKAAKQEPFTIDIYLPIFSCLDEFVAGNLFYQKEGEEYGKIWKDKGYTENKNYPPLSAFESGKLSVETRYRLGPWEKRVFFLPIYVFTKDNFSIRFFFADTYAYPNSLVDNPQNYFEFVGNINVFCWLGNIKNSGDINNNYAAAPAVNNEGSGKIVVEKEEDLEKVVLAKPVDIFYSPGGRLKKINKEINYLEEEDEEKKKEKEEEEENKNKLEFDNNLFSFVFLGKDPFDDNYKGVFAKENRKSLTVEQSDKDIINDNKSYFGYFKKKIQSLFELDRIKNFLSKQDVFLGANTSSAAEDIKELLDKAFTLLKLYSAEKLKTKATVEVEVIKEKNCCEKCCENICG